MTDFKRLPFFSQRTSRRKFLLQVGQGMLVASVGTAVAQDLGLAWGLESEGSVDRLSFGEWDEWVDFLQSTPADQLLPQLTTRMQQGASLEQMVTAAALANARAFGGEDYVGFHTLMALRPALALSTELPKSHAALPVFKVLYRNSSRLQETGHGQADTLTPLLTETDNNLSATIQQLTREKRLQEAELALAHAVSQSSAEGFHAMMAAVEDGTEVHRVVLIHRAWDMVGLVGEERALTMLRQSLRYCIKNEDWTQRTFVDLRQRLPQIMDRYGLIQGARGTRQLDDAELKEWVETLFAASPEDAAEAVGEGLAAGISPAALSEAVSISANQLVLRDIGRQGNQVSPGKPAGSVHGDSIGVHACDSANAWRNLASVATGSHAAAATILGAYQMAHDRLARGGDFANWEPAPDAETLAQFPEATPERNLELLRDAIESQEQAAACALTRRYLDQVAAQQGVSSAEPLFGLLAKYATSEDGALHAEKFFRTVRDEYASTRVGFRDGQLIALARVTASEFGTPAPGYEESCELLGIKRDQ